MSSNEAAALQQMWQNALGIQVKTYPLDLNTYNQVTANHQVQPGFIEWTADFPNPYDWLTLNLFSTAAENAGQWHNPTFDQLVTQAEATSGDARIALYNKAEQLDHPDLSAVIPPRVHGVSINGNGLYFGDWSEV